MKTRTLKTEEIIALAISKLLRIIALTAITRRFGGNGYIIDKNIQAKIASYVEVDSVNAVLRDELSRITQYDYNMLAYAINNLVRPDFQLLFLSLFPRATLFEWCRFNAGISRVLQVIAPKNRPFFLTEIYGSEAFNNSYKIAKDTYHQLLDGDTQDTIIQIIGDERLKKVSSYDIEHFLYFLIESVQQRLLAILGKEYFTKNIDSSRRPGMRALADPVARRMMQALANSDSSRRFSMLLDRVHVNNRYFLLNMIGWEYIAEWFKELGSHSYVQEILSKLRKNDDLEEDQKCFIQKLSEAKVLFDCLGGSDGLRESCKVLPSHLRLFLFDQLGSDQLQASLGHPSHLWSVPEFLTLEEQMHFFRVLGQAFVINNFRKIVESFARYIRSETMNFILDLVGSDALIADIVEIAKIRGYNRCYILQQLPADSQMHYVRLLGKATVDKYINKHELRRYLNEKNREDFDKWISAEEAAKPLPSLMSTFVKFQPADAEVSADVQINLSAQHHAELSRK